MNCLLNEIICFLDVISSGILYHILCFNVCNWYVCALFQNCAHLFTADAKATRQTPLPGGDDVILDDNTDPPGGDDVRLGDPPDSEPRRKRSLRNPWYRILNDLHQRCCMDGCSDEDLMQLCWIKTVIIPVADSGSGVCPPLRRNI